MSLGRRPNSSGGAADFLSVVPQNAHELIARTPQFWAFPFRPVPTPARSRPDQEEVWLQSPKTAQEPLHIANVEFLD